MRIATLDEQRSLRDLAGLPRLCDEVVWCDLDTLSTTADPALIVGLWLFDEPGAARKLLEARGESGLTTVIVPRFKSGDLRRVLQTPTSLRLKPGEYDAFQWDDDTGVNVAGQTLIDSSLHKAQWGSVAGMGVTVLAYRAHEAAGWIVLCTAAVTSKKFGVDVDAQRWLLGQIIRRAAESAPAQTSSDGQATVPMAASVSDLLVGDDANAPAVVLAVVLNSGDRGLDVVSHTLNRIGFEVPAGAIEATLSRLPPQELVELEQALRQCGWGAYLRQGRRVLAEGGIE